MAIAGWASISAGSRFLQTDQQSGTFILSGHPGQAPLIQLNGRPYVAVDALAQLMSGSLSYQGTQITLTLPTAAGALAPPLWPVSLRLRGSPKIS